MFLIRVTTIGVVYLNVVNSISEQLYVAKVYIDEIVSHMFILPTDVLKWIYVERC